MAVSFGCKCPERKKPVKERRWVVIARRCNYSAFNGYHYTPSDWSEVFCCSCHAMGRTRAAYVNELPDSTPELRELHIQPTHDCWTGKLLEPGERSVSSDQEEGTERGRSV